MIKNIISFVSYNLEYFLSCSFTRLRLTLCNPMYCSTPGPLSLTISRGLPKFLSITLVMLSRHLILQCPLLLLPSIFPSIREFSNELCINNKWPKYWSFSFSISPSNKNSGLISLKIDWFDLLAFQGTFRSLLQQHSLRHQFFGVLPSLWSSSHNCMWPLGRPYL